MCALGSFEALGEVFGHLWCEVFVFAENLLNVADALGQFVALLLHLRTRFARVVGMKPVAAGCDWIEGQDGHPGHWLNEDVAQLRAASSLQVASCRGAADALYEAPQEGRPATLTFQNDCALAPGDQVEIHLICAG